MENAFIRHPCFVIPDISNSAPALTLPRLSAGAGHLLNVGNHALIGTHSLRARESATAWTTRM
jgi:hypothetical protein